jgi:hypothetical protein
VDRDEPVEEDVMSGRLKRRIVIAAFVLGVVGLGGTALATSSSGGDPFVNDVAGRLGIAPAKLQAAINGAISDRLNQLVKQGKLTRAQAKAIEQRIKQHGGVMPFAGPFGGGAFHHHHFRGRRSASVARWARCRRPPRIWASRRRRSPRTCARARRSPRLRRPRASR